MRNVDPMSGGDPWVMLNTLAVAVKHMRQAQAAYFRDRSTQSLVDAKTHERTVDGFIKVLLDDDGK